jgi:hypothetical protein
MREFHVDFIRTIPRRTASHGTADDLRPCSLPPNAVAVVTQITCPASRFAEIGEPGILLLCGRPPATLEAGLAGGGRIKRRRGNVVMVRVSHFVVFPFALVSIVHH